MARQKRPGDVFTLLIRRFPGKKPGNQNKANSSLHSITGYLRQNFFNKVLRSYSDGVQRLLRHIIRKYLMFYELNQLIGGHDQIFPRKRVLLDKEEQKPKEYYHR